MGIFRLGVGILAVLLLAASFPAKCLAGDSTQDIMVDTQWGYLGARQSITGFNTGGMGGSGTVILNLTNSTIRGLYNVNAAMGSLRNQGSVIMVNLAPHQFLPPLTVDVQMNLSNNYATFGDYNYSTNLQANSLQGGGLAVMNLMAGNFNNQFSSVALHFSKGTLPSTLASGPGTASIVTSNGGNLVTLTNAQLEAVAATSGNSFTDLGKAKASATVEGDALMNFSGIVAINNLAGNGNQVQNNIQMTINTGK